MPWHQDQSQISVRDAWGIEAYREASSENKKQVLLKLEFARACNNSFLYPSFQERMQGTFMKHSKEKETTKYTPRERRCHH